MNLSRRLVIQLPLQRIRLHLRPILSPFSMSLPSSRLQKLTAHFLPSSSASVPSTTTSSTSPPHLHTLSPTSFLPRAAEIEPEAEAIVHITANGKFLRRNYAEFSDRARGLAYFLRKHNFKRVGILCPNTPAFLESIFGIAASGGVNVAVNYRLKVEDVKYIFEFSEVSHCWCGFSWEDILRRANCYFFARSKQLLLTKSSYLFSLSSANRTPKSLS